MVTRTAPKRSVLQNKIAKIDVYVGFRHLQSTSKVADGDMPPDVSSIRSDAVHRLDPDSNLPNPAAATSACAALPAINAVKQTAPRNRVGVIHSVSLSLYLSEPCCRS
jgi:hypothetical protein